MSLQECIDRLQATGLQNLRTIQKHSKPVVNFMMCSTYFSYVVHKLFCSGAFG